MDTAADAMTVTPAPKLSWYRRLYLRVEALSSTRYALVAMLVVSVIDGSVFPIPPFAILIPMVLARPKRWWSLALMGTVASLGGGLIGYYLGTLIHSGLHLFSIDLNSPVNRFGIHSTVGQLLGDNFWVLSLLCSILPTPFKVVAIGSGMVSVPLSKFMLAAVIGRTVRFYVVAGFMALFGPRARKWLRV
jgi:membrane protein YqaA with SNARE-associated domain